MGKNKESKPEKEKRDMEIIFEGAECPDGGFGWVICIAASFVQFVILGIHNSFGIFYTFLMRDLDTDPSDTAWIGSIAFGMMFLAGPATSGLCQRYGCRLVGAVGGLIAVLGLFLTSFASNIYVMFVTYSILWGFGSSLSYAPTMIILAQWFKKHLALANGIVCAGSGVGSLAMGPFYQLLLSTLGWKVFLRILSCVAVIIFVSALLYRPVPPRYKSGRQQAEKSPPFFDLSVWKNKSYVFWVLSMFMLFVGYFVPFIHLPNHARTLGVSDTDSALLIGYLSIASTVSRLLFGLFLNHPKINRFYVLQTCFLMMAVTTTLCPLAKDLAGVILYAAVFGIFDGCFVLLIALTTCDIVGSYKLPQALGTLYGTIAVPMIFGPPLAGFIFQFTGSYQNAFYVAGGAMATGTCTLSLIIFFTKDQVVEEFSVSGNTSSTDAEKNDTVPEHPEVSSEKFIELRNKSGSVRSPVMRIRPWSQRLEHSTLSLSNLALGRLGESYGAERELIVVDRVSCV